VGDIFTLTLALTLATPGTRRPAIKRLAQGVDLAVRRIAELDVKLTDDRRSSGS